jgi:hypothetical protein
MIAFNNSNETTWQANFIAMLPEIEQKLRVVWIRRLVRTPSKRASFIRSWPTFDWLSKAERAWQLRRVWPGTVRDTSNAVGLLAIV